jgi:aerobic-type carbon monoxide dehydrogenase small subunit (CoxS/CutS family)
VEVPTAESAQMVSLDAITLVVNGEVHQVAVEPQWTLQYVLMEKLGLTGTKEFCAEGACGACSVIMDGRPVLSCMLLAIECEGTTIETIEGIARANHPLIAAYVKHSCMQCGFCTPGFVVTAKALLDRNPDPTIDEIKEAMVGNLCRCGTYPAHLRAITEAARVLRGLVEKDDAATATASVPTNAAIGARAAGMASGGVGPAAPVGPTEGGAGRE